MEIVYDVYHDCTKIPTYFSFIILKVSFSDKQELCLNRCTVLEPEHMYAWMRSYKHDWKRYSRPRTADEQK